MPTKKLTETAGDRKNVAKVENAKSTTIAKDQLKSIIERVERLEDEKAEVAENIKLVMAEAKANGFDTGTISACLKLRKLKDEERQEQFAQLDLYMSALGVDLFVK